MEIWPASTLVALAALVAWMLLRQRAHATSPVDELRADAVWIRERYPEIYVAILKQPGGRVAAAAGHAEEYVASWLGEFDKREQDNERVLSEWRVPA
jgi:hypothetical protein